MGYRYMQFNGCKGTCDCRVYVSHYYDQIRLFLKKDLFKLNQNMPCLLPVASRADSQIDVGLRQIKVFEKCVRHIRIIMLPGMDE